MSGAPENAERAAPDAWARAALVVAVAVGLFGLLHGLSWSPTEIDRLRDDAFYEFAWAANVAAGNGPGVSDGVSTSGVQLLWSTLLVPFAFLFGAAALPVIAPWLGLTCHLAAALLVAWRGTGGGRSFAWPGVAAAFLWLGNPLLVRECQNGQETAVAVLVLVLLWQQRHASFPRVIGLSILAVFARTDLVAFVAAIAALRFRAGPRDYRALLLPVIALAPLFAVNAAIGGGLLPDSGAPMAWLWSANFAATDPTASEWLARQWWFSRPIFLGAPWLLATGAGTALLIVQVLRPGAARWRAAVFVGFAVAVLGTAAAGTGDLVVPSCVVLLGLLSWRRAGAGATTAAGRLEGLGLLAAAAAILTLHWAVRWYPRDYYAAPLALLVVVAIVRSGARPGLVLLVAALQLIPILQITAEPLVGQRAMTIAGRFVGEFVPAGERVGCFNSGLVTFHADVLRTDAERHGIVNLDGVVNPEALAAMQERALDAALDDWGVRFLLDNERQFARDPAIAHACGRWFGGAFDPSTDLREVARFVVPGHEPMVLFWRVGRGAAPASSAVARDLGPCGAGRVALWPAQAGEVLEVEVADGTRLELATVERATTAVIWIPCAQLGTGRLFVRGHSDPLLRLSRL